MNKLAVWCWFTLAVITAAGAIVLADTPPSAGRSDPVKVKAVRIGKADRDLVTGMGSIKCHQTVDLGFEMSGVISDVPVKEADRVKKDQVLAKLDHKLVDLELAIKKAKVKMAMAQLDLNKAEHTKREELYQKEAISESELNRSFFEVQKADAELESAKREIEALEGRREQMILRASGPGIVSKIYLRAGEVCNPNSYKVIRFLQCADVDAEVNLGERLYPLIGPGQPVTIVVDALGGRKFSGSVHKVSSEINPTNRTFTAQVRVPNADFLLRPGMFARAEIDVGQGQGPVWVPLAALLPSDGTGDAVFVVKGGVALRRKVTVGQRDQERAEIVSGLQAGDVVIVEGQDKVSDLTDVSVSMIGE